MASDALSLLFELNVDGRPAAAGLQRFRKELTATIEGVRRAVAQPVAATAFDKAAVAVQKLAAQSQELANRQERARQSAERLAQANQRLAQSSLQIAAAQLRAPIADAHVKFFRAVQKASVDADHHVRIFRANQAALARAPQVDAHVRAFKAIQKGVEQADKHVRFFRANQAALAKAPQLDRHVQAFRAIEKEAKRARAETERLEAQQRRLERSSQSLERVLSRVSGTLGRFGSNLSSIGRTLSVAITAPILALSAASLKSAKDLDANVNTLKAFTGSAQAAERRLAQLIKTARDTPGLTTNLALTLDAQLRVARTTQETIDRVLPAIGRLNAVSRLPDPGRFVDNLKQLITQNFERQDLKELVGQSPLAGQLITEIFNVDSATNAKAIRAQAQKLGLTTVDAFFNAFAEAAERNQGLANVTESIGTRFDKIVDRVTVALRPLGLAILSAIEPFIEPVAKLIERIGKAFDSLSAPVKTAIVIIGGLAAVVGPLLFILGGVATAVASVVAAIGTIGAAVAAVGLPAIAAAIGGILVIIGEWVAILAALGLAWKTNFLNIRGLVTDAATAVSQAFQRIRAIVEEITRRILPTLQSITGKVLAVVTLAWERYGKDVVAVVRAAFTFVTRVVETFVTVFGNIVDLLLKLIDGDFRGAWAAFARIVLAAVDAFDEAINKLPGILLRAFAKLNAIILAQAIKFTVAGQALAAKLVVGIVTELINSAPKVRDALVDMFLLAAQGFDPTSIAAILVARFIAALRRAARDNPPPPQSDRESAEPPSREDLAGAGEFRQKQPPAPTEKDKGADAETRRRIRILELEAEKAEAIAQQRINAENIHFEQRRISLKAFTDFQIEEEEIVLNKKRAVFAAERAEAEKLGKGRDLALKEIRLRELKAEIEFADKRNQLLANQTREELEAAKSHRQALLDIQDEGDQRQLELIDSYVERYIISFEEAEQRRLKIEQDARDRRRAELEIQLGEAGQNAEERQRVSDAIAGIDAESATAKEDAENRKRRALRATLEAERDYYETLHQITQRAAQLIRDAANIELDRLIRKFGDRRRFRLEALRLEREANEAEHKERLRQIQQDKKDAEKRLEGVRDAEEKLIKLRKFYRDLEEAERKRRAEEKKKEDDDQKAAEDPFGNIKKRFRIFKDAITNAGDAIRESVGSLADTVNNALDSMVDATKQGIEAWILYGESLGKALKQALAQQLATLAAEFAIQALKHAAYALGSLAFGNFAGAAKHAAAAAAFTAAAAATGFAGRALAKSSGLHDRSRSSAGTAANAVAGGEPANRQFNYGGQGPVESAARAVQDGSSGSILGRLVGRIEALQQQNLDLQRQQQAQNAQVAQALAKLGTARPGDVVTAGAAERPDAIGVAVINHSNSSGDFNERLQRNLGFA